MSGLINSAGSKSGVIGTTELDYEEGTWTAAFVAQTGSITIAASHDQGLYTKIGRTVHVQGYLAVDSVSTPSGGLEISGLPFSSGAEVDGADHTAFTVHGVTGYIGHSETQFYIQEFNGTSNGDIANHFTASSYLMFSGTYCV